MRCSTGFEKHTVWRTQLILLIRYMACYEEANRDHSSRFGGLTEFVFGILLELGAEAKPVSLTEIYAHAKTIWHKLPEELIKRFQSKDFKYVTCPLFICYFKTFAGFRGNIRSTLYACQIFIRPGESQEEKKTWMLRGRPEGSTGGLAHQSKNSDHSKKRALRSKEWHEKTNRRKRKKRKKR